MVTIWIECSINNRYLSTIIDNQWLPIFNESVIIDIQWLSIIGDFRKSIIIHNHWWLMREHPPSVIVFFFPRNKEKSLFHTPLPAYAAGFNIMQSFVTVTADWYFLMIYQPLITKIDYRLLSPDYR